MSDTTKTILMAFAATLLVLGFAISGCVIVFADELEPYMPHDPPDSSIADEIPGSFEYDAIEAPAGEDESDSGDQSDSQPESDTLSTADNSPQEYIPSDEYDREVLLAIKNIEYQVKIIAGGMVLALISAFIWFTILKPFKLFTHV